MIKTSKMTKDQKFQGGGGNTYSSQNSKTHLKKRKVIFLSGTRADWGKIKPLVQVIKDCKEFDYHIFVCGMHLQKLYGQTFIEIFKDGFENVYLSKPHSHWDQMDLALSHTIKEFSSFIKEEKPDLIIVHGDRLEALAGAIVGAFNNIPIGHIEGGEVSGTIDESIRHSISKLSHLHFVANAEAKIRLLQLGEKEESIFTIGSPDIDVMLNANLPSLDMAINHYHQLKRFDKDYAIFTYHPVTTELDDMPKRLEAIFQALKDSKQNFLCIYPNNDPGSKLIIKELDRLKNNPFFISFASIKFEFFLTFLKHARFIIGNSSAGIREAPIYGTPAINLGSRQNNRYKPQEGIISASENYKDILDSISKAKELNPPKITTFGDGKSAEKFLEILQKDEFWNLDLQKSFVDIL